MESPAGRPPRGGSDDPFPRAPFMALLGRLPRYARLGWRLGRDPRLSRARRAAILAGAAYLASPIDLVPGVIPVAGQLDDAAAALIGLRVALNGLTPDERREALAGAGLTGPHLDEDLRTIGACYAWLARRGGRLGWRGIRAVGRAAGRAGTAIGRRLRERPNRGS